MTLSLVAVVITGTLSGWPGSARPICESPEWARIVSLAIAGGPTNRQRLTSIARRASSDVNGLAKLILEQWNVKARSFAIAEPRLLRPTTLHFTPEEAVGVGQVEASTFVVSVAATERGCVADVDILKGPEGPVRDVVVERLRDAVFFPASDGKRPVSAKSTIRLIVDVT